MAQSQLTTGTFEAVWPEHSEDVTPARIDSWTYDPDKGEVSVEGLEDNLPADQHRRGAIGLPRVELQHEKHTWKEEAVEVGGYESAARLVV